MTIPNPEPSVRSDVGSYATTSESERMMSYCQHCGDAIDHIEIYRHCRQAGYQSHNWGDNVCLECGLELYYSEIPHLYIAPQFGGGKYGPLDDISPWQDIAIRELEEAN